MMHSTVVVALAQHIAANRHPASSCHVVCAASAARNHFGLWACLHAAAMLAIAHFSHAVTSACLGSTVHRLGPTVHWPDGLVE
jgi:hypothetical protein